MSFSAPFQGDRVVDAAAQVEEVGAGVEPRGDVLDLRRALEHVLDLLRQLQQLGDVSLAGVGRERPARLGQVERQQVQGHQLRGEGLGRGDADLGPGVGVDGPVALPRRHAADDVADGQAARALPPRLAQRRQGVGGLTRLGDRHGQRRRTGERLAVAVLGPVVHVHRQAGEPFDQELADQRRVPRRAAGHQRDPVDAAKGAVVEPGLVGKDRARFQRDAAQDGVAHRRRLLEDLLEHEVLVAGLLGGDGIPGDPARGLGDDIAVEVREHGPARG